MGLPHAEVLRVSASSESTIRQAKVTCSVKSCGTDSAGAPSPRLRVPCVARSDRYDARKNMFDWDYQMRLVQAGADIVHWYHFRDWRSTGATRFSRLRKPRSSPLAPAHPALSNAASTRASRISCVPLRSDVSVQALLLSSETQHIPLPTSRSRGMHEGAWCDTRPPGLITVIACMFYMRTP